MNALKLSSLAHAVALCAGTLMFCGTASAMGDRAGYDQAKASAKSTYEADSKACDSMAGNPKDVCVAEAKAKRTKTEVDAEAAWKDTPKAREHAAHETAEADYKVAKERCDAKGGNEKDVCIKEAKAAMTKTEADAKAMRKTTDAHMDASKDKMEANYKVAAEKCDSLAGDAKNACVANAKARYHQ
ncbi:MAG: hypothetical protein M3Y55_13220 [Pseudomonadota bacterium]|nr:hypothetical protein [Pseudomonadota bacterium]